MEQERERDRQQVKKRGKERMTGNKESRSRAIVFIVFHSIDCVGFACVMFEWVIGKVGFFGIWQRIDCQLSLGAIIPMSSPSFLYSRIANPGISTLNST